MTDQVTAPATEAGIVQRVIALRERKSALERELRTVKEELAPVERAMLDEFARRGETSARDAETGKLVYVNRQVWARPADGVAKPDVCRALEGAGLGTYVEETFNTHSLSGYFREEVKKREAEGEAVTDLDALLPEGLRGVVALTDDHKIGIRS